MAEETGPENNTMIGAVEKNSRDTIVVQIREFKGKHYVDIRNHYHDTEGELKPTQKGISIEVARFQELKSLIDKVDEAIKKLPA